MLIRKNISLEIHGAIAVVRIDVAGDEAVGNPNPAEQLAEVCRSVDEEPDVRVVIFGNTAGAFWRDNAAPFSLSGAGEDGEVALQRLRVASCVADLKVPTIAAVRGRAWNQGLELALACDLRLVVEDATFGFSCLSEGFMPWDGGTQRLSRIVGRAHALDLLLTGRSLGASEARHIGLVNAVALDDNLDSAAMTLARTIADAAPVAVRYLKEAVYKGLDMSLGQGLNLEADLSFILQTTEDRERGIQSFLNKTTPEFTGE